MITPPFPIRSLFFSAIALLCAFDNRAGTFTSDFNAPETPVGMVLAGSASILPAGGANNSGVLSLTTIDPPAQTGAALIEDMDNGVPLASFTANFKVRMGGPSASPAFGMSFSFGEGVAGTPGTDGVGNGLKIVFETFDRGNGRAPTIDVWFANQLLASRKVLNLRTGSSFVACSIRINEGGTLDLDYDGVAIYRNLFCYTPQTGPFAFGASTGGIADYHWIDDLTITTQPVTGPTVRSLLPAYNNASPAPLLQAVIADFTREDLSVVAVNPATIQMKFDYGAVAHAVTSDGAGVTTIKFEPSGVLVSGSTHTVELSFADNATPAVTHSIKYDFVVTQFQTLPASFAVAAGAVDTGSSGFNVRVNQVSATQPLTVARAERQIAGELGLPNIADLTGAVNGVFEIPDVINWSQNPIAAETGFFQTEGFIPGIPGTEFTDDNIALEAITYLDLQPGVYTFGLYADDGYKLTTGANPRDAFAYTLGAVDAGKGATTFTFAVTQAGVYPFRLLYYEGQGGAGLEWFSIDKAGNRILINDRATVGHVKAYRVANSTRAYVRSVTPKPGETGVAGAATIDIAIEDGSLLVDPNSIELFFNNLKVTPTLNKPTGSSTTTISFDPPGKLASESTNTVRLKYGDSASGANPTQQDWSFTVIKSLSESASRRQQLGPDNLVVLEAEDADANISVVVPYTNPSTGLSDPQTLRWIFTNAIPPAGGVFSGSGAMAALPNIGSANNINTALQPHLDFKVDFVKTGTHYIWVRGWGDSPPGPSANDSVNVGIDGTLPATSDRIGNGWVDSNGFVWANTAFDVATDGVPRFEVTTLGEHQVNLWMREDGFIVDKILLTTNPNYAPGDPLTEVGAPQTPRNTAFLQDSGADHLIVLEAENAHANASVVVPYTNPSTGLSDPQTLIWVYTNAAPPAGGVASGTGAMAALPNIGSANNINTSLQPHLDFSVNFVVTGTHYIWVRGWGDSPPGPSANDSVNVGLDGVLPATSDRIGNGWVDANGFVWANTAFDVATDGVPRFEVTTLGEHQVNLWMREDGFIVDKILITTNPSYVPGPELTDVGPPESARVEVAQAASLTITKAASGGGVIIGWTGAGALQFSDKVTGGTWAPAPSQANPQTVTPAATTFWRVVGP